MDAILNFKNIEKLGFLNFTDLRMAPTFSNLVKGLESLSKLHISPINGDEIFEIMANSHEFKNRKLLINGREGLTMHSFHLLLFKKEFP